MERGAANIEEGQLNFANQTCGYAFACFLLGRPANTQTPEGIPLTFPRANRWGAYINDDFKVNSRLTVNLGLRFDYNGWGTDAQGLWRTLDIPGVGADIDRGAGYTLPDGSVIPTIFPGVLGEEGAKKLTKQQLRFFMPRIGIAFRPTEKTVIRMGAGWFDNIQHLNTFTIFNLMPPKAGSQAYQTSSVAAQTVPVNAANGQTINLQTFRYAPNSPVLTLNDPFLTSTGGAAVVRPIDVVYLPPDYKDGDVWKWSFDVQRELPWNVIAGVGYAGSKASHIGNSVINWNDPVTPVSCFPRICGRIRNFSIRRVLTSGSSQRAGYATSIHTGKASITACRSSSTSALRMIFRLAWRTPTPNLTATERLEARKAQVSRIHATAAARAESTRSTRPIGRSQISFGNFLAAQ